MGKSSNKKALDDPAVKSWVAIMKSYRHIFSFLENKLLQHGCGVSRFQILLALYFEGPLAPVQLAERMSVSRANMTHFLRRLVEDKLVRPVSSTAKRPQYELSEAGVTYFEELFPVHISNIKKVVPVIPEELVKNLTAVFEK